MSKNQSKILPIEIILRCALVQNEEINENLKVKLVTLVLKEFRKNREATRFRQQKEYAGQMVQQKLMKKLNQSVVQKKVRQLYNSGNSSKNKISDFASPQQSSRIFSSSSKKKSKSKNKKSRDETKLVKTMRTQQNYSRGYNCIKKKERSKGKEIKKRKIAQDISRPEESSDAWIGGMKDDSDDDNGWLQIRAFK